MRRDLFAKMNNALLDLQSSQPQTYERPLKELSILFEDESLKEFNLDLTRNLNLEDFLEKSSATQRGMMGSARLEWPEDKKDQLGLTLLLLHKFALQPDFMMNFGFTYFYTSNKIIAGVHSIVRQVLIPFVRDYKALIDEKVGTKVHRNAGDSTKIFIVHGHDGEAREMVARYIESLGFTAVILHEQVNKGRTVIEKVEANSDVGFAVVLLTPDDEGCTKGGSPEPRARQNVLLELGYFMGFLGRERVCALKKGELDIPSDFAGVVWESMETSNWKQSLGRELAAAGYEIDWNKVMR